MARQKNDGKGRMGGRAKGTLNKRSWDARELCEKLGVDPLEVLLKFAKRDWEGLGYPSAERISGFSKNGDPLIEDVVTPQIQSACARDAAKYIYAQLKAIEHSGPDGKPMEVNTSALSADEIDARIKKLISE